MLQSRGNEGTVEIGAQWTPPLLQKFYDFGVFPFMKFDRKCCHMLITSILNHQSMREKAEVSEI
jgi:hypothetical protein